MNEEKQTEVAPVEAPAPVPEIKAAPKNGESADSKPRKKAAKRAKAEASAKMLTELVEPKKAEGDAAPEETKAAAMEKLRAAVAGHAGPDGVLMESAAWLTTARRR